MKRIALAILIAGLVPAMAGAQTPTPRPRPLISLPSFDHTGTAGTSVPGGDAVLSALAKPFQDLADFLQSDATQAAALATQIPALQDGHGQQCWNAMSTAGAVFKAHPVPVTLKVMTDIEALRLLQMTANNLCQNVHCTQVFADLTSAAQAASPMPLPIPSLHDLCSKIPQIAVVPPAPAAPANP